MGLAQSRDARGGAALEDQYTLFFGEHLPRIQKDVPVGDDAAFVDAPRPRGVR